MSDDEPALSVLAEDANALTQAALALSRAMESQDHDALSAALDVNLELWIGIRTMVSRADNPLPKQVRDNLLQLSQFVTKATFNVRENGVEAARDDLDAMINSNLQISEGLLESEARA